MAHVVMAYVVMAGVLDAAEVEAAGDLVPFFHLPQGTAAHMCVSFLCRRFFWWAPL